MRRTLVVVICLGVLTIAAALPVQATMLKFKITNKSAEALNSFTVTLRGAAFSTSANRLSAALAPNATTNPSLSFDPGGTSCVFDLTFITASGKITDQPDTDLCQTDAIMFQ